MSSMTMNSDNIYEHLFFGKAELEVADEATLNKNRQVIYQMSQHIAWVNREHFKNQITDYLDDEI